jgi:S-adenosylmethionine hydrolase
VVTLTTDFGLAGHHAGVVKGVILGCNPAARLVDLSHAIPPGDLREAAWTLLWSWRFFPPGTIHLAVVDPGVGSPRRPLAASAGGHFFVGPDNGVLDPVLAAAGKAVAVGIDVRIPHHRLSSTFHGRDVFAPTVGRLSLGVPLRSLGEPVADRVRLELPQPRAIAPGVMEGEVIAVDRWGNLVTSLTAEALGEGGVRRDAAIRIGRRTVRGIGEYYAQAAAGAPVAVVNSNDHLEVAVNRGDAARTFHAGRGTRVVLSPATPRRSPPPAGKPRKDR